MKMTARPMGSATISFGLVSIPVKLYASTSESNRIAFHLLHGECGSRLKQQYICPSDNVVVAQSEMVKGYEFSRGQYVHFSRDEIKQMEEKPSESIDISEFVPLSKVDLLLYDRAYYLGPDKGGNRAYALLTKALLKTGRAAVAQYAARGKQYLVLLRPVDTHIVMQQLRYPVDIKPLQEVPATKVEVDATELELATELITQRSHESFQPEKYKDGVQERLRAAIERKVQGSEVKSEPQAEPRAQIVDLMAALKASLGVPDGRKPAKRVGHGQTKKTAKKSTKGDKAS